MNTNKRGVFAAFKKSVIKQQVIIKKNAPLLK